MKTIKRYCKSCKRVTLHTHTRAHSGVELLMVKLITIGLMPNEHIFICQVCDTETEEG